MVEPSTLRIVRGKGPTNQGTPGATAYILIVDDDPIIREAIRMCVEHFGYRVREADSGEEALALLTDEVPDLILLDVRMPGINGITLCAHLKADTKTRFIPIVLLTTEADLDARVAGLEAGADDYFTKPVHPRELAARLRSLLRLKRVTEALEHAENLIGSLALTIEARDTYTAGHCVRLATYAVQLGERLRLSTEELEALQLGGFLHDLGKIAVPDQVLMKPGPLSRDQWRIMREHAIVGDRLAGHIRTLTLVRPIIRHHHERMDGRGYPDKLAGEEIPILARIMAIVDVYDALRTRRAYKPPLEEREAIRLLREASATGHLDAALVRLFIDLRSKTFTATQ